MFRSHTQHLQRSFLDTVTHLSSSRQERLANSWAGEFYREVFCRLDEAIFASLYADVPSRPNTPVNQLVGIEVLKSGYGWSDEELCDHLAFDLQVRYALGVRDMESEICTLRTIYNFRRRVSEHMQTSGENLFEQAFAQVTDGQCRDLGLDTRRQRMDSTQIASNIRRYSRLRLVVEVLQRATRMLSAADQEGYADVLQPYLQGSAGQYCYRVPSGSYAEHLAQVGQVIAQLLSAWASDYAAHPAYGLLQRVFHEHFSVTAGVEPTQVIVTPAKDLSADSLQSPDDLDASYRQKNGQGYRGYAANVTETCTPENPVQLITHVQVAPNTIDDQTFLAEAVPALQERMALTDLDVDGAYIGPEATQVTTACGVTLYPTAIRGAQPDPQKVSLAEFTWEYASDRPAQVTCPQHHRVPLQPRRAEGRYIAEFAVGTCAECPLRDRCPTRPLKRRRVRVLRVTQRQIEVAQLRQTCAATRNRPPYLRPAVEATVRSIKHPFGDGPSHLPVRGQARVTMLMIASGLMVNLRRIWRYRHAEREKAPQETPQSIALAGSASFLSQCRATFQLWMHLWHSVGRCSFVSAC